MATLIDNLSKEKVTDFLSQVLEDEKNPRRRENRLESYVYAHAGTDRNWLALKQMSLGELSSEEELDSYETKEQVISPAALYMYEQHLAYDKEWGNQNKTPENIEKKIMVNQPGRWAARFPQNRRLKESKNSSGLLYDAIKKQRTEEGQDVSIWSITQDVGMTMAWHFEMQEDARIIEVKKDAEEELGWGLVVVYPDGTMFGKPTKSLEDIIREGIVARTKTTGISGRKLNLKDPFLGALSR